MTNEEYWKEYKFNQDLKKQEIRKGVEMVTAFRKNLEKTKEENRKRVDFCKSQEVQEDKIANMMSGKSQTDVRFEVLERKVQKSEHFVKLTQQLISSLVELVDFSSNLSFEEDENDDCLIESVANRNREILGTPGFGYSPKSKLSQEDPIIIEVNTALDNLLKVAKEECSKKESEEAMKVKINLLVGDLAKVTEKIPVETLKEEGFEEFYLKLVKEVAEKVRVEKETE